MTTKDSDAKLPYEKPRFYVEKFGKEGFVIRDRLFHFNDEPWHCTVLRSEDKAKELVKEWNDEWDRRKIKKRKQNNKKITR